MHMQFGHRFDREYTYFVVLMGENTRPHMMQFEMFFVSIAKDGMFYILRE
jgi:hypothetical protein